MGKPRLIILIRHAQSEGNKNRDIHQTVPDHRVKLTADGWKQAEEAGLKLRSLLLPTDTLHIFTSPYRRTRETTHGILSSLTRPSPSGAPSPFPLSTIKVYEEPRLREQDFGNFQPCSADMSRMWHERANYGHFFYRIPNGESAADAYDRVSGFNESLWRSFSEETFASVCVLVTHGLMTRVFLMKWYHFSVEYFEDLRNIEHCEFVTMRLNKDSGSYVLESRLRTWSEGGSVPVRKKWVVGEEEGREVKRQNTGESFLEEQRKEKEDERTAKLLADNEKQETTRKNLRSSASDLEDDPRGRTGPPIITTDEPEDGDAADNRLASSPESSSSLSQPKPRKTRMVSPNRLEILKAGRDGGGSHSGRASLDVSSDSDEGTSNSRKKPQPRSMAMALNGELVERGMRSGVKADALGDQSDVDEEQKKEGKETRGKEGKEAKGKDGC